MANPAKMQMQVRWRWVPLVIASDADHALGLGMSQSLLLAYKYNPQRRAHHSSLFLHIVDSSISQWVLLFDDWSQ